VACATPTCSGGGRTTLITPQWPPQGIPGVVRPPLALHSGWATTPMGGQPATLGFRFTSSFFFFFFPFFFLKKKRFDRKKNEFFFFLKNVIFTPRNRYSSHFLEKYVFFLIAIPWNVPLPS
jgi:hypothetical protein